MNRFPILQTAFSGYRLLAARPGAAIAWFIFEVIVTLATAYATATMVGPQLAALKEMQTSGAPDPATAMALSGQIMPFNLLSMLFAILMGAILMGAILRAVLRPGQSGFGYLRFGADELRLFVVSLVIFLFLVVLAGIAYALGMIGMMASAGRQGMAAMQGHGQMPIKAILIGLVIALPAIAAFVALYIRLSLAAAQTVGERGIRIFGSWRLTKGVFWRTLATYVVALIPVALAMLALTIVSLSMKPGGLSDWKAAMQPDFSSLAVVFSGGRIALQVAQALLMTIYTAALVVPTAMIYRAVAGESVVVATDDDEDDEDED
jgi:hypothetical protein